MPSKDKPVTPVDPLHLNQKPIGDPPRNKKNSVEIDIDDAQIEEPKDKAFREGPESQPSKPARAKKRSLVLIVSYTRC